VKLVITCDTESVKICHLHFSSDLPSVIIEKRSKEFKEIISLKLITHSPAMFEMLKFASMTTDRLCLA